MGKNYGEIMTNLDNIIGKHFDVLEWRADFYEDVFEIDKLTAIVDEIKDKLREKPLLFTIRTSVEGGNLTIDVAKYKELLLAVIEKTKADLVDVEYMREKETSEKIVRKAHSIGKYIIGSYHDFEKTPDKEEIYNRLLTMKNLGMDISKIALMPQSKKDVLTLFETTNKINEDIPDILTVTMSMGQLGAISRIALGKFGSVMTFGAVGQVSAPGQYDADKLYEILNTIY